VEIRRSVRMNIVKWLATLLPIVLFVTSHASDVDGVGFNSVEEAKRSLALAKGISADRVDRWQLFVDDENGVVWVFPEKGRAGYPSVIRRRVVNDQGHLAIETRVLCEAVQSECEALMRQLSELDVTIQKRMQGQKR
jgi:hypothetical protein